MGIKQSDMTEREFADFLAGHYQRAHDALDGDYKNDQHPIHDVRDWAKVAAGNPVEDDEDEPAAEGGATDSRRWRNASTPVRVALDSAMQPGRSPSDSLALAEASLRQSGWDSELMTELRSYHAAATAPRGAADATSKIPGYGRLR